LFRVPLPSVTDQRSLQFEQDWPLLRNQPRFAPKCFGTVEPPFFFLLMRLPPPLKFPPFFPHGKVPACFRFLINTFSRDRSCTHIPFCLFSLVFVFALQSAILFLSLRFRSPSPLRSRLGKLLPPPGKSAVPVNHFCALLFPPPPPPSFSSFPHPSPSFCLPKECNHFLSKPKFLFSRSTGRPPVVSLPWKTSR